jgi:hypothetical protein
MQELSSDPKIEMRTLIGIASQIARRGYGEAIIELALHRKGVSREVARLIAASVVSCRAAIVAAQGQARLDMAPLVAARNPDLCAARVARVALSRMASFLVFIIAGIGGGAFLGWSIGFDRGVDDGFDWIVRALERLIAG